VPKVRNVADLAFSVNAVAPLHLARTCTELGARLVHVSTDYVFDGAKRAPYVEEDRPAPLNVYGMSKVAGEHAVLADGRHQVVRSSGLYGLRPCRAKGGNFIDTMFRVAAEKPRCASSDDEVLTPTFTARSRRTDPRFGPRGTAGALSRHRRPARAPGTSSRARSSSSAG
jgi:dTDP-4-dehydrorhamnose reductase